MKILSTSTKLIIYGSVFLVPLVFWPFTFEKFELPKLFVLFVFVATGLALWFFYMVFKSREIVLQKTPLNLPILALMAVSFVSTIFSSDVSSSLFGSYGRFSNGFLGTLAFGGLYFLIINTIASKDVGQVIKIFFASLGIALTGAFVSHNFAMASMEGFSVLLAAALVALAALPLRVWSGVLLLVFLGFLVAVDFTGAWFVLLIGLLLLLGFLVYQSIKIQESLSLKKVLLPMILLLGSFVFLFSPPFVHSSSPKEAILPHGTSWHIAFATAQGNVKNLLLGSGPGTFQIDVSRYGVPPRVDRAGSFLSELLATEGVLGLVSYSIVVAMGLLALGILLVYKKNETHAVFFSTIGALIASQLVYYQNTVLGFAFWLVLALGIASFGGTPHELRISLKKYFEIAFAARLFLLLILAGFGVALFFAARIFRADMAYAKSQAPNSKFQIDQALKAVNLNPYRAEYAMRISQLYLQSVFDELKKPQGTQDRSLILSDATDAIRFGVQAKALSPNRSDVLEALAGAYRNVQVLPGAKDQAETLFKQAQTLEPANPILYNELGTLYLEQLDYETAKDQFSKALAIAPSFVPSALSMSLVFEKEGNTALAILKLEDTASQNPANTEILFQLGRLYFNTSEIPKAKTLFLRVLALDPANSNAHFALGEVFEKQGNKKDAKAEYQKVAELNPHNQEVLQKLQQLK